MGVSEDHCYTPENTRRKKKSNSVSQAAASRALQARRTHVTPTKFEHPPQAAISQPPPPRRCRHAVAAAPCCPDAPSPPQPRRCRHATAAVSLPRPVAAALLPPRRRPRCPARHRRHRRCCRHRCSVALATSSKRCGRDSRLICHDSASLPRAETLAGFGRNAAPRRAARPTKPPPPPSIPTRRLVQQTRINRATCHHRRGEGTSPHAMSLVMCSQLTCTLQAQPGGADPLQPKPGRHSPRTSRGDAPEKPARTNRD